MKRFGHLATALAISCALGCGGGTRSGSGELLGGPDEGRRAEKLTAAYGELQLEACLPDGLDCTLRLARAASADLGVDGRRATWNPRSSMKNPDPIWLREWDKLPTGEPSARYTYAALALAATNKSWAARCHAAYAEHDRRVTAELDKLDKGIAAANREPNPYDRLGALFALEPAEPSTTLGEFLPGSDAVRYRWEAGLFEAFEDTARTYLYLYERRAPKAELLGILRKRDTKEHERDAFCLDASRGDVAGLPPLPTLSPIADQVRGMVKAVVSPERARQVEARRAELTVLTRAKFAKAMVSNPQLPDGVREITLGKVQRFERDGKRAMITVVTTRETKTGKTTKIDETSVATFADWPSGLVLEPGDSVSFYGAEKTLKDTVIKSTPQLEHLSRQTTIEGKHVSRAVAKGKAYTYWD